MSITPQQARLRDITYSAEISVDIEYSRGRVRYMSHFHALRSPTLCVSRHAMTSPSVPRLAITHVQVQQGALLWPFWHIDSLYCVLLHTASRLWKDRMMVALPSWAPYNYLIRCSYRRTLC